MKLISRDEAIDVGWELWKKVERPWEHHHWCHECNNWWAHQDSELCRDVKAYECPLHASA